MADPKTNPLVTFYESFKKTNSNFSLSNKEKASNNISAVNALLDSLMGKAEDRIKAQELLTTKNETTAYGDDSNKPALPSFNARTPYMEIWLNNSLVVPSQSQISSNYSEADILAVQNNTATFDTQAQKDLSNILNSVTPDLDISFQDLSLSMPMGGVNATITGNLTLYSRTPIEFLTFLMDEVVTPENVGLPNCRLRFGWNIARTDGQVEKLLSPYMTFLVMNVAMTDPGKTMGSEFVLTLQDAGSAVLENSSADCGLLEDWPQQQLRIILEKYLGLRLFTLDDLLQLGKNADNEKNFGLSATTEYKTSQQVQDAIVSADRAGRYASGEARDAQLAFIAAYNKEKSSGLSDELAVRNALISDKTFFLTNQVPALRVNSNTFANVVNSLLNKIVCRWYPTDNNSLDKEITAASAASGNIKSLIAKFNSDNSSLNAADTADFEQNKEKVASTCILTWVPYFPKSIYTSSNNLLGDWSQEEGAFLLLPKITTDYSLNQTSLPLIYGPGGSAFPYFYGGAQNVFARISSTLSDAPQHFSRRVGEVIDVSANFSNLITVMKAEYNEGMSYRELGVKLNTSQVVKETKKQKQLARDEQKKKLEAELKKKVGNVDPAAFQREWEAKNLPKFRAIRGRFQQSIAPRYLVNAVEYASSSVNGPAKSIATNILQHRIGTFLNYPYTIGMVVLGDPYLLRQGIGAFELINYFPSMPQNNDNATTIFKYNPFLSGVFMPQKITHKISLGDYTTEIEAVKVPDKSSNSAKGKIAAVIKTATNMTATSSADQEIIGNFQLYQDALLNVNLDTLTNQIPLGNVYKLTPQDQKLFDFNHDRNIAAEDNASDERKRTLMGYYKTTDWDTAKKALIRDLDIALLDDLVDTDPELASNEAARSIIKQKIKGVYSNTFDATQALQFVIGGAKVDTNSQVIKGTSSVNKLDSLYAQLQTSRYEDIRKALESQAKKQ